MALPRLRQVALVARQLAPVVEQLQTVLGLPDPFRDEAVGFFGLQNAVFTVGDHFLEVVSPHQDNTPAGRYLERHGGDGGYMAMFEVDDAEQARARLAGLGVRVVWEISLPDITDLHLHPRDVTGAIVALDSVDPPGSWRWGGPEWEGQLPPHVPDGVTGGLGGLRVAVDDPVATAQRWAQVVDLPAPADPSLVLDGGAQTVAFVPAAGRTGIVGLTLAVPGLPEARRVRVAGVDLDLRPTES